MQDFTNEFKVINDFDSDDYTTGSPSELSKKTSYQMALSTKLPLMSLTQEYSNVSTQLMQSLQHQLFLIIVSTCLLVKIPC